MPEAETGQHLLLWIDPRDGIATDAIRASGGAWMLRYWDGESHDGAVNHGLRENAAPDDLARWVSGELGRPVIVSLAGRPRKWVPYMFRDCGAGIFYHIDFALVSE